MDYDDVKKSKFNAGVAHAERIDMLQRAINSAKFNPLMFNFETGTYNYSVMISSIDCLTNEGWDKFSPKEKETVSRMNTILRNLNEEFPPITINKNQEVRINHKNYKFLMSFFQMYERKIKELYGLHNLNSPTRGEEDEDEL